MPLGSSAIALVNHYPLINSGGVLLVDHLLPIVLGVLQSVPTLTRLLLRIRLVVLEVVCNSVESLLLLPSLIYIHSVGITRATKMGYAHLPSEAREPPERT